MRSRHLGTCLTLVFWLMTTHVFGQFEDEFPPGLHATYSAGGKTVHRIDPDISFAWGESAPDSRLAAGLFQANWSSLLLVRQEGRYRIHAYLQGAVNVSLDGVAVLQADSPEPGWVSGELFDLDFGEKELTAQFRKTVDGARLHLFWSSDKFFLEPIPTHLLFRDESHPNLDAIERGKNQFTASRCNRCHRRQNDPLSPPAPALTSISNSLSKEWIVKKLTSDSELKSHEQMPSFGVTADEAEAIAAFLNANSTPVDLTPSGPPKKEDDRDDVPRRGEVLIRSMGCLACHTIGEYGDPNPLGGGDLSVIGDKRSADWLNAWLSDPKRLNPDHRMPIFKLNGTERWHVVQTLANLKTNEATASDAAPSGNDTTRIEQGRRLVERHRCAACHRISGIESPQEELPDLATGPVNWLDSCLKDDSKVTDGRPFYAKLDAEAVKSYVESHLGPLSPEGHFARGQRLLEERNCLQCHDRDQSRGIRTLAGVMARIDPELNGKSEGMIPPALTAVGDKFQDDALATAVSGRQKSVRLPWLSVRMPQFEHSSDDIDSLLAYLIGHDRIPEDPPASTQEGAVAAGVTSVDQTTTLLAGRTLVGAKGFSCIACHQIGEYEPRNVALGTRGSDLMRLEGVMREEYFLRWTRSPLRIVPGMEMPSYTKPVKGLLNDDVEIQLATMWKALNHPRFEPPTNPSVVEQLLTVEAGEPARIVRDVFTNPENNGGGYVPRALAIGLNNGHNVLFDLDAMTVRQWTLGDMARQRTVGKSWYWDMAGVAIMTGFSDQADIVLQQADQPDSPVVWPHVRQARSGRLQDYEKYGDGVRYHYEIDFKLDEDVTPLRVTETVLPDGNADGTESGWQRHLEIANIPNGYQALIAKPTPNTVLGAPKIELISSNEELWRSLLESEGQESRHFFALLPSESGSTDATLRYSSDLQRDPFQLDVKPALASPLVSITSAPGFDGVQLPIDGTVMPTAMCWRADGTLAFTSLKGHVFLARDTDGDGVEDSLEVFEEGLAAPYGIIADGDDLIVTHKSEMLRLRDTDGDGRADYREVITSGWGYNDNYHDWTTGIVRDTQGNMYIGLGSDYSQPGRPQEQSLYRGKVLKVTPDGEIVPFAHSFRYPTGLAIDDQDRVFSTDNQGVQNCFNEINYLQMGNHYGVPSLYEEEPDAEPVRAAIQVPHPWTRSVNGIFFLPSQFAENRLARHGVGCEFNSRLLVRFTYQEVGDSLQGAVYYLTQPDVENEDQNFLGPLCGGVSPDGSIYIGSIHDSGWLGGRNTGSIVRLEPNGRLPNGIRELRATHDGFELEFFAPVDPETAALSESYTISGYTRVWEGGYATPDSGRYRVNIESVEISDDAKTVKLQVDQLREQYVYEVTCSDIGRGDDRTLWPSTGHYSMNVIP